MFNAHIYIPHGHCYLWQIPLVSLHIIADGLIAIAYYSIPLLLLYFLSQRQDVPFARVFFLFSTFIVACGTTHILEIWTLWYPVYWVSGMVKAATAFVSVWTAVAMVPIIPAALALPSPAQLNDINQKLAAEIQERKSVEAALRRLNVELEQRVSDRTTAQKTAEQTAQMLMQSIPDLLIRMSQHGEYLEIINADSITLYNPRHFKIGCHIHDILPAAIAQSRMHCVHTALATQISQSHEYQITINGKIHEEEARVIPLSNAEVLVVIRDITERKRNQDILEQQLQRTLLLQKITDEIRHSLDPQNIFRTTTQLVGDIFKVDRCLIHSYDPSVPTEMPLMACYHRPTVDAVGHRPIPIVGNPAIEQLLRTEAAIAADQVRNDPRLATLHPYCEQAQIQSFLAIGTFYKSQPNGIIFLHQCDRYRHWQPTEIELLEAVAAQVGIAHAHARLLSQETEQRQILSQQNLALEAATKTANAANQAKSEFLANMSHEIRTPIHAILGFSNLLNDCIVNPQGQSYIQAILAAGRTLLALINDILDLSKIEAGKLPIVYEAVDIPSIVEEIRQIFSQKAIAQNLDLTTIISPNIPHRLEFDPIRLRQILFNVVGNALKFTQYGSVTITVNFEPTSSEKGTLSLIIQDTGIGIAAHQQEHIFSPFLQGDNAITRQYGGTGLGLSITNRLTELLGGKIHLDSVVGEGSCFTFQFPQVKILAASVEGDRSLLIQGHLNQIVPLSVLIVDDVASNREVLLGYFSHTHHTVRWAGDGVGALRQLQDSPLPDVMLLDINLPQMSGIELLQVLRNEPKTAQLPVIVVTAVMEQRHNSELNALCNCVIIKPFSYLDLLAALDEIFSTAPGATDSTVQEGGDSDPNRMDRWPDLMERLQSVEQFVWPQVIQMMIIQDIQAFNTQLLVWGNEFQCLQVLDYAHASESFLNEFDLEGLLNHLRQFPELRSQLFEEWQRWNLEH